MVDTQNLCVIPIITSIRHARLLYFIITRHQSEYCFTLPLCWSHNNMSITLCNESIFAPESVLAPGPGAHILLLDQFTAAVCVFCSAPVNIISAPALIKPAQYSNWWHPQLTQHPELRSVRGENSWVQVQWPWPSLAVTRLSWVSWVSYPLTLLSCSLSCSVSPAPGEDTTPDTLSDTPTITPCVQWTWLSF